MMPDKFMMVCRGWWGQGPRGAPLPCMSAKWMHAHLLPCGNEHHSVPVIYKTRSCGFDAPAGHDGSYDAPAVTAETRRPQRLR